MNENLLALECKTSSIDLKELAKRENSEVTDKESKLRENCKALFIGCVSAFLRFRTTYIYTLN
jgi:hypothetical protein